MEGYDWPHAPGISPLAHQKVMANFCVLHPRCFNLSDMGTMKTLATLWAADWLMEKHGAGKFKALIVAPLSTLHSVWSDAIFLHLMGKRTCVVLVGSEERRCELLARDVDFYIVNFDGTKVGSVRGRLGGFSKALAEREDIQLAIVDEASAYKHHNTRRHRIGRQILDKPYLWLLTGTPTAQGHLSAYGQAKLVNNANGESWGSFVARTTIPVSKFKRIPTQNAHLEARKLLTPAIRYDIKDVWDGPPFTTQTRDVELTAEQRSHMKALKTQLAVQLKDGTLVVPANEAAARAKFLQICLGAIYDHEHMPHYIDSSPRLNELKDVISQAPSKLIIFSPLTSVINLLYRSLADWSREIVNGDVSLKDRTLIFQRFQLEDEPRIIIADPVSLHLGVTLHRAQTTVWYGPTDKTEVFLQANKRAHRPGQKFPVTNVQIVSTPLEREIYKRLANNQLLQGALLEMVRKGEL